MPETSSLGLPLLAAEQAQKHVTHNEALRALDALVHLSVFDRDPTAPPGSPGEGDRYIVGASATGAWAGHDGEIAAWQDGAWAFYEPQLGWRVWVEDESLLLVRTGAAWEDFALLLTALQNLALLGIGTVADATNPLSAKLNNILFTAKYDGEGGDGTLRYKMNKETAADVLSLLLQTNFSGRAEIGLVGDDDLLFKVSPDGSAWVEALRIDKDDGSLTLGAPEGPVVAHDPSLSDANAGGYKFRFSYVNAPWSNGPVGETDYVDDVWGLGINYANAGGARIDATKPALGWTLESKFYQGGRFNAEAQFRFIDTAGAEHRPISIYVPHDGGAGSDVGFEGDYLRFEDFDGTEKVRIDNVGSSVDLLTGYRIVNHVNNTLFLQQKDSAGSFRSLFLLDSQDRASFQAGAIFSAARNATSGSFFEIRPTSVSANDAGLLVNPSAAINALWNPIDIRSTNDLQTEMLLLNTGATGNSSAGLNIQATGGDAYLKLQIASGGNWILGNDNSASDRFAIGSATSLGSADKLTIESDGSAISLLATLIRIGGTTSSFPALKRSSAALQARLADDSAYADFACRNTIQNPQPSVTPANNGELVVEATDNSTLTFKLKGTDGTVRTGTLALA